MLFPEAIPPVTPRIMERECHGRNLCQPFSQLLKWRRKHYPLPSFAELSVSETLPRRLLQRLDDRKHRPTLRHKIDGVYTTLDGTTTATRIRLFARGLIALGVKPGERVAIMAPNGPDWVCADIGAMSCGAVSVPIYHTEGLTTLRTILDDSGARVLFIASPLLAHDLMRIREDLPELATVIQLGKESPEEGILSLSSFLREGGAIPLSQVAERLSPGQESNLATIVYTSGTTGQPKGAMLSHRNLLSNVETCSHHFHVSEGDTCLSFLPLSHVFERMAGYYLMLIRGAEIAYAENFETVPTNLQEVSPTIVISVPRLYEKMHSRVMERVLSGPWLRKQLFFAARHLGLLMVTRREKGIHPSPLLRLGVTLARKLVFAKLHRLLGGKVRFFVSGGAPLGKEIAEFFMAAGIPIYEGYGLTETSPVIAANAPGAQRLGSVGRPLETTSVRLAADGEIQVQGPGVFSGYWNDDKASDEAFAQGWFKTGDIGRFDDDGYLYITDRKKDLIVTAGGENVAPQYLEGALKRDKYIANALIYGDRKPFLCALLVPNLEALERYANEREIPHLNHCDLVSQRALIDLIRDRVDALQSGLPPIQQIKRFTLLSRDFTGDEITPTLKLRRKIIHSTYRTVLEGMYLAGDHGVHDSGFCALDTPEQHEKVPS